MDNRYVDTTYLSSTPYAIVFWTKRGELEASCKTICYSEEDIMECVKRNADPKGMYSKYLMSIHLN